MKASLGILIGASGLAALTAFAAPGAKAACLTEDIIGLGTTCATFEAGLSATAKVYFASPNLAGTSANGFWQIGATTSNSSPITLSNIKWANSQNGTYSPLLGGSLLVGPGTPLYSTIQSGPSSTTAPVPTGTPFWIQYDIPSGLAVGTTVGVQLISNNDNSTDTTGLLSNTGTNGYYSDTRINTAALAPTPSTDAAPGPLPLLGAGAAFGASRRLRSRIRSAA